MWEEMQVVKEDLEQLNKNDSISWIRLKDKKILVTGGTGLIGCSLIKALIYVNEKRELNLQVYALVRDVDRARRKYEKIVEGINSLTFIEGDVENIPFIKGDIDYIIHGASPTASSYFIEKPVETIRTAVLGTMNMLELAKEKNVEGFVYLSSMEIYGSPKTEEKIKEEDLGYINPLIVRNCYPEGKRQCEALCVAYYEEYQVPAMSIRLAQTFGPGVDKNDQRVFAEFARCAIKGEDIVLLTDGISKRCYLYTMDAVSAIITVLLNGQAGTSYNAANENTYCSVREMANLICEEIAKEKIKVKVSQDKDKIKKFSPPHFYNLDSGRLRELGWNATRDLKEMYLRMIKTMD